MKKTYQYVRTPQNEHDVRARRDASDVRAGIFPPTKRARISSPLRAILHMILRRKILLISTFILVFFLPIAYLSSRYLSKSEAAWFDDSFAYRQTVAITNSSGSTLTSQRVKITLNTSALIPSKMQANCNDIRVTDMNGKLLDHWKTGCNSATTYIYVKIPSIPTSGTSIYLYYGNPSAANIEKALGSTNYPGTSCAMMKNQGSATTDGTYYIVPGGNDTDKIQVYCDVTTLSDGWTLVLQNNTSLTTNPEPVWSDAVNSVNTTGTFGSTLTAFDLMLGLKHWNYLGSTSMVQVGTAPTNITKRATYSSISLNTGSNYALSLGTETLYLGATTPGIKSYHAASNFQFTTSDADNDVWGGNCANNYGGSPWWYGACWDGNFWGGGDSGGYQNAPFWSGSGGDYHNYGAIYLGGTDTMKNVSSAAPTNEEKSQGPVAYWKFDEGYGTTPSDSTGHGKVGSFLSAPVWKTEDQCVSGKCLAFDNVDDGVSIANENFTSLTDYTMCAWVNPKGNHKNYTGTIMSSGDWNNTHWAFGINQNNTGIDLRKPDGANYPTFSVTFPLNRWTYTCITRSGVTITAYVNSNSIGTYNGASGNLISNASNTTIGRETYAGGYFDFNGWIDEPKIYNYARTAAQIKSDFNSKGKGVIKGTTVSFGQNVNNNDAFSGGLVGYWKLDESATPSVDSSGNSNSGTWYGTTAAVSGKYGNGAFFDGDSDYIEMADTPSLSPGNAFTFSTWIYQTAACTSDCIIFNKENEYEWRVLNGSIDYAIANTSPGWAWISTGITISQSTWTHLVLTYDNTGQVIRAYKNGALVYTRASSTGAIGDAGQTLRLAARSGPGSFFGGRLDETRIYNRALSPSEVSQLYNYAPGPITHYKFDEGSFGGSAIDSSGNNLAATVNGATNDIGKFGKGARFNGTSNSIIKTDNSILRITAYTVSAWIKPEVDNDYWTGIVGKPGRNFNIWFGNSNTSSGYVHHRFHDGAGTNSGCPDASGVPIDGKTWTYVTITNDGTTCRTYFNGIQQQYGGVTGSLVADNTDLQIGRNMDGGSSEYYRGIIDDVKIYNYARTSKQIIEDMNAGHPAGGSPVGSQVGYWKFDEGYGTNTGNSGNAGSVINGTLTTNSSVIPTWSNQGKFNKALSFNGTSAYVTLGTNNALNITDAVTVSSWVRLTDVGAWYNLIYSRGDSNFRVGVLGTGWGGVPLIRIGTTDYLGGSAFPWNTWTHLVFTFDDASNTVKIYVNGKLDYTNTSAAATIPSSPGTATNIGFSAGSGYYANGSIDEIKIYNSALTEDEIKLDYSRGSGMVLGDSTLNPAGSSQNNPGATCATIKTGNSKATDGVYWIKPVGTTSAIQVYCDMTRDGGGWTLGIKSWYLAGIMGSSAAVGTVADATTRKGNAYKLADTDIRNIIGSSQNFDIMADQNGYNTWYSTGNYEYIIARNYTGYFRFDTAVAASSTTTTFQSYRLSDNALAWTGNLGCGYGGAGINCYDVISNNPQGGAGCNINMGTASNSGWHHFYMSETNQDTYLYICNGPQHSSSHDMNHRWWFRERGNATQSFSGDYPPVAEWNLEEGTGGNANDTSGNGNTGSMQNSPSWINGNVGKGLQFNGSNQFFNTSATNSINTISSAVTMEAWINKDDIATYRSPVALIDSSNNSIVIDIDSHVTTNGLYSHINTVNQAYSESGYSSQFNLNQWYHVAVTYTSGSHKGYVNGQLVWNNTAFTGNLEYLANNLIIRVGTNTTEYFKGKIDNVRVYNYVRSPAQIAYDYNRGAPVGHWKFDECQGITANDSSGNGSTGSITIGGTAPQTSAGTCTDGQGTSAWYNGRTGKYNSSLNFDGADDFVSVPYNDAFKFGTGDFTISWWANHTALSGLDTYYENGYYYAGFLIRHQGELGVYIQYATGSDYYGFPWVPNLGTWYYMTLRRQSGNLNFYVNGVQISTTRSSAQNIQPSTATFIGHSTHAGATQFFNGKLDDFRVYNYALSADQVKQLYNGGGAIRFAPTTGTP